MAVPVALFWPICSCHSEATPFPLRISFLDIVRGTGAVDRRPGVFGNSPFAIRHWKGAGGTFPTLEYH